ncbi:hypothetical protein EVAR_71681_1, partial [Eumeta japonica]
MCQRLAVGALNGQVDSPKQWFSMAPPPAPPMGYRRDR